MGSLNDASNFIRLFLDLFHSSYETAIGVTKKFISFGKNDKPHFHPRWSIGAEATVAAISRCCIMASRAGPSLLS